MCFINSCQTDFSSFPHALSYFLAEHFGRSLASRQPAIHISASSLSLSLSLSLFQHVSPSACSCSSADSISSFLCSVFELSLRSVQERDASVSRICFTRSPHLLLSLSFFIRSSLDQRSLPRAAVSPSKELRSSAYSVRGRNLKQVMSQWFAPAHL